MLKVGARLFCNKWTAALLALLVFLFGLRIYEDVRQGALMSKYLDVYVSHIDKETAESFRQMIIGKTLLELKFFPYEINTSSGKRYVLLGRTYNCYCQDAFYLKTIGFVVSDAKRVSCEMTTYGPSHYAGKEDK